MNKASGGDGIPVELFQILKDDAVEVLHSICQQIWKTQQWPQDWKRSVLISWLQSPSAVIWEPPKIKPDTVSTVSPSISHEVMGLDAQNSPSKASTVPEPKTSRCSSWI